AVANVEQPAGFRADLLAIAAQQLGVTRASLQQELLGRSLAQVSAAHAMPVANLKTTLVDAEDAALQKATAAGTVTQAQANQQVSLIPNMVQTLLDRVVGARSGPSGLGGSNARSVGRPQGGVAPRGPRPGNAAPAIGSAPGRPGTR